MTRVTLPLNLPSLYLSLPLLIQVYPMAICLVATCKWSYNHIACIFHSLQPQ